MDYISKSLIGWGCSGCSQLSTSSAKVPTRNLPSRAPASPLIAFRNSLMLVISFVRPMSARMSDTSQRHSESRRPAEWQSARGAVPKPPRCQIPTEPLTITSPQAPAQADTGNRGSTSVCIREKRPRERDNSLKMPGLPKSAEQNFSRTYSSALNLH